MPKLQEISLSDIGDSLFDLRFNRDDRPIQSSIQNFGLLSPPYLYRKEGQLFILDGLARVAWFRESGELKIPCHVIDETDMDAKESFLLCLELNHWCRQLNVVERARSLKKAQQIFGGLKVPKRFWQRVGIRENIRIIHQHKELLKLPDLVLKFTVNNNISLSIILGFLRFPKDQIEAIARHLFILPLNQNKLAEILGSLLDISKREEIMPLDLLEEVLSEVPEDLSAVQREQRLRQAFLSRRNPIYESQLSAFDDKLSGIPMGKETKVSPAPYFEDDYLEINAKVHSLEDLRELADSLTDEGWQKLFESN